MIGAGDHANANTAAGRGPAATTSPVIVPAARCHSRLPFSAPASVVASLREVSTGHPHLGRCFCALRRGRHRRPETSPQAGRARAIFHYCSIYWNVFLSLSMIIKAQTKKRNFMPSPLAGCGLPAATFAASPQKQRPSCGCPVDTSRSEATTEVAGRQWRPLPQAKATTEAAAETREPRTAGEKAVRQSALTEGVDRLGADGAAV